MTVIWLCSYTAALATFKGTSVPESERLFGGLTSLRTTFEKSDLNERDSETILSRMKAIHQQLRFDPMYLAELPAFIHDIFPKDDGWATELQGYNSATDVRPKWLMVLSTLGAAMPFDKSFFEAFARLDKCEAGLVSISTHYLQILCQPEQEIHYLLYSHLWNHLSSRPAGFGKEAVDKLVRKFNFVIILPGQNKKPDTCFDMFQAVEMYVTLSTKIDNPSMWFRDGQLVDDLDGILNTLEFDRVFVLYVLSQVEKEQYRLFVSTSNQLTTTWYQILEKVMARSKANWRDDDVDRITGAFLEMKLHK